MRVATVDGLVTLFYDGSKKLWNCKLHEEWERRPERYQSAECKDYIRERMSWQQIIIEEGVTEIPDFTFDHCYNIKRVIFANTVIRIGRCVFYWCKNLEYIKLSISLEVIGSYAFLSCDLSSVFIPPTCREIGAHAFSKNKNLSILHVPQQAQFGIRMIDEETKLLNESHLFSDARDRPSRTSRRVNDWLKNINDGNDYSLHRACSSFQPLKEVIWTIIEEKGLKAFKKKNGIGITPSRYLAENPFTDITEMDIIHDYITKQMGECV
ncbi:hypothetical protein CTEN210_00257 [Chaetoceros tenuissimus]|uniref:Leucine-rich repeat domain-containing protein n=1 Tax=Chaetoceros tenuissimus TaxID=426638 RepID=A0AAD3CF66_9STRA|nr:hypothetical protein CTEN210_00257 [Chaetoceros tenuissimus]